MQSYQYKVKNCDKLDSRSPKCYSGRNAGGSRGKVMRFIFLYVEGIVLFNILVVWGKQAHLDTKVF